MGGYGKKKKVDIEELLDKAELLHNEPESKKRTDKKLSFWKDKIMYCPHCKRKFIYIDMWKALAKDLKDMFKIATFLNRSFKDIRDHLQRYYLEFAVTGTMKNAAWREVAMRANYSSVEEMLYEFKVKKGWSYEKIGRVLGKPKTEIAEVFEYLFDPEMKESERIRKKRLSQKGTFDIKELRKERRELTSQKLKRRYRRMIDKKAKEEELIN